MLRHNVRAEAKEKGNALYLFRRKHLRKVMWVWMELTRLEKVDQPMTHPMQLKCSRLMLEHSFGHMMESAWR